MPIITYPNIIYPKARSTLNESSRLDINQPTPIPASTHFTTEGPSPRSTSTHTGLENTTVFGSDGYGMYGYPIGGPLYTMAVDPGRDIYPWMHSYDALTSTLFDAKYNHNMMFAVSKTAHVTSEADLTPIEGDYPLEYMSAELIDGVRYLYGKFNLPYRQNWIYQFRGSTTPVNPENDPDKDYIINNGLENFDKSRNSVDNANGDELNASPLTPTSPLHPFMRMYADRGHEAVVCAYNRTRIPIADIEHRKAFRYIFITRPECYLMTRDDNLCQQAFQDDDIRTCWHRFPHVIRALSPVYISPSRNSKLGNANWNYLLSNRVMSMGNQGQTLSVIDSMTKSVRGATITPGKQVTSNLGGTIDLTFRDTKYFDVYETLRIWMWYIHKRRSGQFFPPFNGYQYVNGFTTGTVDTSGGSKMHPYDRAIEYGATIFDIITNETGTKILYWCKYYGVYPTNVQSTLLSNQQNAGAILGEATVTSTFQYQYKQENVFKTLVEFNYNAGLFDNMGKAYIEPEDLLHEVPFLYRENGQGGSADTSAALKNYIGAASLITGSPFIISEASGSHDAWTWKDGDDVSIIDSFLRFIPLSYINPVMSKKLNLGITSNGPGRTGPSQHSTSTHQPTPSPQSTSTHLVNSSVVGNGVNVINTPMTSGTTTTTTTTTVVP